MCFRVRRRDLESGGAEGFVKGEVRLVAADQILGGVDNGAVELKYIVNGHEARVGVQAYAEEALVGLGGAAELVDEIVGAHGIIVSSIRGWGEGEGTGHDGCEWASPRFLAEPRNDRGYGEGGTMRVARTGGGLWP